MGDRFQVCRALYSPLACAVPVGNSFPMALGFCVVVRQDFGLVCRNLWKLLCQHVGNTLMVLLPGTVEQRLVGGVPDQGMFEEVRRLGWYPTLVQQLRLHQLLQRALERCLVPWGDRLEQVMGKLTPQGRPELCQTFR